MSRYKRLLSLGLVLPMVLSLSACGKKKTVQYDPLPEEDNTIYHICLLQDEDNDYYDGITMGFKDALADLFGESKIKLSEKITEETQLIFANGADSLTTASTSTQETPIVGAGVLDYQHLLHLTVGTGDKWNKKTGTNVTGVSSLPDIAAQLSLIIETTEDLKSVGLLYTPDDSDSLYQLAIMEKYLDQAGIPWKEYALPLATSENGDTEDSETTQEQALPEIPLIKKTKIVASSATEGSNNQVDIFGGTDLIDGLLSPSSVHAPLTSEFWTPELSTQNTTPLSQDASLQEIISYASAECSCLFLPTGSYLTTQIQEISEIATSAGVTTVGGDASIGAYTLTSTYMDSYALGYSAAKKAYRILVNGDDPGELKITNPDVEVTKLYNKTINETFQISFPKSFHEISDFMEQYEIGSSTNRITEPE